MIKQDELQLWKELWRRKKAGDPHPMIYEIAKDIGMNWKRMNYIAEKWDNKGLIDSGVSARTGWIAEGITEEELMNK